MTLVVRKVYQVKYPTAKILMLCRRDCIGLLLYSPFDTFLRRRFFKPVGEKSPPQRSSHIKTSDIDEVYEHSYPVDNNSENSSHKHDDRQRRSIMQLVSPPR